MSESSKLNVLCTGENKNDSIKKQIEIVSSGEKRVYKSVAMGLTEIELIQVLVDNTRVPGIIKQQHNQLPKTFLNQFYCLRKAGLPVVDFFYIKDDPEYVEGEECTSIQSAMGGNNPDIWVSTYNNKSRWQSDFINKKIDIIQNIDEFLGSLPAIIKNADKENIHLSAEAYYLIYDSIRKQLSLKVGPCIHVNVDPGFKTSNKDGLYSFFKTIIREGWFKDDTYIEDIKSCLDNTG